MGNLGAIGMADAVRAKQVTLEGALGWHLGSNHYPPLDTHEWVPVCLRAIHLARKDDWEVLLLTPAGPKRVQTVVEGLHLYPFLEEEEEG